jgi:hypothetical protein
MARNGSGVMSIPYPSFTANTTIQSAQVNSDFSTIVDEITNSIAADGQTTISANIPFNAKKITGLGTGTARTDGANLATVQDGAVIWCGTAGGTADALTLSPSPAITAYSAGQTFRFKAGASANTGPATVAVSGLSAIAIQNDGSALATGDIAANKWFEITYDGAAFQISRKRLGGTGTGDVTGPASATANGIALFDGTTGKAIKDSTYTITAAGAALLDDADAAAQRATLGLGTAATAATGTSGNALPFMNGDNTWSGSQRGAITTDNDGSFDQNAANNFFCTTSGSTTLTFTNHTSGQSGLILFVNASNHAVSAAATTKIKSADLTTISATGTYLLTYFDNGTNAYVVASGALT